MGTGFGRLFDVYEDRFENIILTDYSLENLKKARERVDQTCLVDSSRCREGKRADVYYVALNAYHLPFKEGVLDCLLSVRLMHHLNNVPEAIGEISRALKPKGKLVLEYANKRHFFEVLKALIGRSKMRPFSLDPAERGEGPFYNFHPKYMGTGIRNNELRIMRVISVSNLRHGVFKKILGIKLMLITDKLLSPIFNLMKFGPSILLLAEKQSQEPVLHTANYQITDVLVCPKCKSDQLMFRSEATTCENCGSKYNIIDNIYDFRL